MYLSSIDEGETYYTAAAEWPSGGGFPTGVPGHKFICGDDEAEIFYQPRLLKSSSEQSDAISLFYKMSAAGDVYFVGFPVEELLNFKAPADKKPLDETKIFRSWRTNHSDIKSADVLMDTDETKFRKKLEEMLPYIPRMMKAGITKWHHFSGHRAKGYSRNVTGVLQQAEIRELRTLAVRGQTSGDCDESSAPAEAVRAKYLAAKNKLLESAKYYDIPMEKRLFEVGIEEGQTFPTANDYSSTRLDISYAIAPPRRAAPHTATHRPLERPNVTFELISLFAVISASITLLCDIYRVHNVNIIYHLYGR